MNHLLNALPEGLTLSEHQLDQFRQYNDLLQSWNKRINLTAIDDDEGIQVRHFADSLTVATVHDFSQSLHLADLGTGAGFPGLPLKIAYPHIDVTLIDSVSKKIRFLDEVIEALAIDGTQTVDARIEDAGQREDLRETFDVVTARALAYMPTLAEYMLPLCKVGGVCIAMKGDSAYTEVEEATNAFVVLGGTLRSVEVVQLPNTDEEHYLVVIEKTASTPLEYPRRVGRPSKRPL